MFGIGKITAEVRDALKPIGRAFVPVAVLSGVLNILTLAGSFFMLLVYDEVLPSRSVPTLVGLLAMVSFAYAAQALLDLFRSRITGQLGTLFAGRISARVIEVLGRRELTAGPLQSGSLPVRDLDQVRGFLSGPGPLALLDLPWVFLYLGILFLFHWSLGLLTLFGIAVLLILMVITDRLTHEHTRQVVALTSSRYNLAENTKRNADTLWALGMSHARTAEWVELERRNLLANDRLTRVSAGMMSFTKSFRMLLQSAMLAAGAFLVIHGDATGGVIIAGSIISARALAPIEQTIGQWRNVVNSLEALQRLREFLDSVPRREPPLPLPAPTQQLDVQTVVSGPPGERKITVADVSFSLKAGDGLAIIGRSGSGKSSLGRAICGIWPLLRGSVRLDGASLDQYDNRFLGRSIGYVPQSIELFDGTLAQNISRFDLNADPQAILAAAEAADVHDMIVQLEGGYEYRVGPLGGTLSAGQMQRIALARALYGNPFLLILDEPNSNLDGPGEQALLRAVDAARERGAIPIIIAHRPNILSHVSHVLVMNNGRVQQFGPTEKVDVGARPLEPAIKKISADE